MNLEHKVCEQRDKNIRGVTGAGFLVTLPLTPVNLDPRQLGVPGRSGQTLPGNVSGFQYLYRQQPPGIKNLCQATKDSIYIRARGV